MNANDREKLPSVQKLFLMVVVPFVFLLLGEIACRVLNTVEKTKSSAQPKRIELPTWMLSEAGGATPSISRKVTPASLEWLEMFEEGPGFRVRLRPNITKDIVNTFSLLPTDKFRRYRIKANSLGFRGPEITPAKGPDTFRILVFGDSSSFGWGVNQEEMFSTLLQEKLQRRSAHKSVETANFAIPGDSSEYGRLIFDKYAKLYRPDLVILGFGANDAKNAPMPHRKNVAAFRKRYFLHLARQKALHSALYRTMENLMKQMLKADSPSPAAAPGKKRISPAVSRKRYRENLAYMAQLSQELGSRQVLVLAICMPAQYIKAARAVSRHGKFLFLNGQARLFEAVPGYPSTPPPNRDRRTAAQAPNRAIRDLLYVTSDGCHPNAVGNKIIADNLYEILQKNALP